MLQISSNGNIFKGLSTYPKINTFSRHIFKVSNCSDPLLLLPNFAMQSCRIDFVHIIYFWFPFYCTCASSKHELMHLFIQSEMEKWGASLFLKWKYVPPIDPSNPLQHRIILSIYTIYVSRKLGQWGWGVGGGQYSVSRRRCLSRIHYREIYSNDLENGIKVTWPSSNIFIMSLMYISARLL